MAGLKALCLLLVGPRESSGRGSGSGPAREFLAGSRDRSRSPPGLPLDVNVLRESRQLYEQQRQALAAEEDEMAAVLAASRASFQAESIARIVVGGANAIAGHLLDHQQAFIAGNDFPHRDLVARLSEFRNVPSAIGASAVAAVVADAPSSTPVADTPELALAHLNDFYERVECKICLERHVDVALRPCGHCVCATCAPTLRECPFCRAPVGAVDATPTENFLLA